MYRIVGETFFMNEYKLLLVDDEEEVRDGILKKIDWIKYGFEIIGAAENGKEALEIMEKELPDLVITDIKMPYMDGMQLCKVINEKYPMTKIIVLTGFDEFHYAQKSISYNVMEYLLKPISATELTNILIKVKSQFDKEFQEKKDIDSLKEYYKKSLAVLKEKFLISLVTTTLTKEEIDEKARSYNLNLNGSNYVVSVVSIDKIDHKLTAPNDPSFDHLFNAVIQQEKELLNFAVLNIAEEITTKNELGLVFLNNDFVVIIHISSESYKNEVTKKNFSVMQEIKQTIEKFLKNTVTIGIGNVYPDVISIHRSYASAITALDYKLFMGSNRIICIEDIEPKSADRIVFDDSKEHALESSIKVGTIEEVSSTIDWIFNEISNYKATYKDYQIYLMEVLTSILKAVKNSNVEIDDIFGSNTNLYLEMYSYKSIEEIQNWFKNIAIRTMKYITKDRQDNCKFLVDEAKNFIKKNYQNNEMSINTICDYLHISPTYFSFIFKKETKTTFINYLTQIRMDAAKELLKTTNMKAFEIADKVGYSDANYFSYSFKKKFGLSPSEFRINI